MATINLCNDNVVSLSSGVTCLVSEEFDLGGYTTAQDWKAFELPAGSLVLGAMIEITESAGETCTVDVGYTGSLDVYLSNANMNQTAGTLVVATVGSDVTGHVPRATATEVLITADGGTTYAAGKGKLHLLVARA